MRRIFAIGILVSFLGCAGEDYNPVYFPGATSESAEEGSPRGSDLDVSKAQCRLELRAKLCVKIKGDNIEVGISEESPLCADTPPILFEIEGEKITLRGSDFPDIHVSVDIRGVATPMTINGKGDTDGSSNVGSGSWTLDGDILIQDFSFFINVLGMSGEIPNIDLTTDEAKEVSNLPSIQGKPADESGQITLVAATVLGSLFEAADEYLLGASLQALFNGTLNPPLSECASSAEFKKQIRIVKLRKVGERQFLEEPLPEGNILEVSNGTYIAEDDEDVGPLFEAMENFKAINEGESTLEIKLPNKLGPFYFSTNGGSKTTLQPGKSFEFQVTFKPDTIIVPEAGVIKEAFAIGGGRFTLSGVALGSQGRLAFNQVDEAGNTLASNIEALNMNILQVPAAPVRDYFRCEAISCDGEGAITECQRCTSNTLASCSLYTITSQRRPMEEVNASCEPLEPRATPLMTLNLSGANQIPIPPSRQVVTLQNQGVTNLEVTRITIEELENSQSKGQFQLLPNSILAGETLPQAEPASLPITLSSQKLFIAVAYLPTDLLGVDGNQASPGQAVTDKAYLMIETNNGIKKMLLIGKTKIQEIPPLQVLFGTPTGFKAKVGLQTFAFEEVTQTTQDLAYPVFLLLSEAATAGVRITEVKITGEDQNYFEWLDSQEEVASRQPPSGAGKRCSIPVFDLNTNRMIDEQFELNFVAVGGQGFDLKPGVYSQTNLPLFGCVNFHPSTLRPAQDSGQPVTKRIFEADLIIQGFQLDSQGRLIRNPDGTFAQVSLPISLVAAMDPIKGKLVLRISQTIAAILNPQAPSLTAVPAKKEVDLLLSEGRGSPKEAAVLLGSLILDPFDEMPITDSLDRVVSEPGDGVTGVFRALDTRPTPTNYDDNRFFDFATLLHDSDSLEHPGIFYDYDLPERPLPHPLKTNGWRIFTGALSYPGPLSPRSPISMSECEEIDPCSPEGLRQFTESGIGSDGKGACAYFFASGASYHSPAFEPVIRGESHNLCDVRDQPQELLAMDTGHYSVDGSIAFEDIGLRFWGPTYIHNPHGPLGFLPPLDEVFHITFTTEMLKPTTDPNAINPLPDEKIDFGRQEFKINLTETDFPTPAICPKNTANRRIAGRRYSSWRYMAPFIFKDEEGEIPAGCPEEGNGFSGGTAYLRGRRLDPETKIFTIVAGAKFGSREELSLAFKNIMIFVAMNGWVCDPQGLEENFEGAKCFDPQINERDAKAQITIVE